jgi:hypothetical protein
MHRRRGKDPDVSRIPRRDPADHGDTPKIGKPEMRRPGLRVSVRVIHKDEERVYALSDMNGMSRELVHATRRAAKIHAAIEERVASGPF